jgi:hypothetical protein
MNETGLMKVTMTKGKVKWFNGKKVLDLYRQKR